MHSIKLCIPQNLLKWLLGANSLLRFWVGGYDMLYFSKKRSVAWGKGPNVSAGRIAPRWWKGSTPRIITPPSVTPSFHSAQKPFVFLSSLIHLTSTAAQWGRKGSVVISARWGHKSGWALREGQCQCRVENLGSEMVCRVRGGWHCHFQAGKLVQSRSVRSSLGEGHLVN